MSTIEERNAALTETILEGIRDTAPSLGDWATSYVVDLGMNLDDLQFSLERALEVIYKETSPRNKVK
ncbi:hypothetical protein PP935_gp160 [Rhizobium phage RHph_N34]|uniref:Uncharacterized protein n=1 Tax=Rhizobium phage RHph_N34 TaxID=2509586 RepID=A0A7S5UX36_9CAUD|nr:hypothetical protein PP935_gp160 [Rhizobium phage RHph_N34]QIG73935.1 hypothetical protein EVC06_160 [Rhizobium phage RHph_N34]